MEQIKSFGAGFKFEVSGREVEVEVRVKGLNPSDDQRLKFIFEYACSQVASYLKHKPLLSEVDVIAAGESGINHIGKIDAADLMDAAAVLLGRKNIHDDGHGNLFWITPAGLVKLFNNYDDAKKQLGAPKADRDSAVKIVAP